jgi:sulfate transport system permease protein
MPARSRKKGMEGVLAEPAPVRISLIAVGLAFVILFLGVPLVLVFAKALGEGAAAFVRHVTEPYAVRAIRLTLVTTAFVVPLTLLFGLAAAWAIARFEFRGKNLLTTLIDLPFTVSPVIAGLLFVLLFGAEGFFGEWLREHDIRIVFALPGIVLATLFVTSPLVARELIPLLRAQGIEEEEAAVTLGARGLTTFLRVSLPRIKWGLFYGVVLCTARSVGEFGAVSVVSGHVRGRTTTVPLHVEMLYNEYQFTAAFAVASLLSLLALVTLILKGLLEWKAARAAGRNERC